MGRYLIKANYTNAGVKGLLDGGGAARRDVIAKLAASAGGTLESLDFAFGGTDVYVIVDLPDNASAAKVALTVGAAGGATCETVVLLSADELPPRSSGLDYTPPSG